MHAEEAEVVTRAQTGNDQLLLGDGGRWLFDDFVHLMSGVAGAIIAWRATFLMPLYFKVIGTLYDLDALVGMTMSRGLLDLSVFRQGPGPADFSLANWAINMPHIVLATLALWIGFRTWRDEPGTRPAPRLA